MAQEKYGENREQELEHAAMCSEALMEEYLETGALQPESMALSLVFLMLMSISFAGCFYTVISDGKYLWFELGWCCIFAIFSMIFDWRAERTIKNRIRITLGIYEAIEERRKKKL